jgi:hypothetical protein
VIGGGGGGYSGGTGGARREAKMGGTGYAARDSRMLFSEPGTNIPPRTNDPDYDGLAGTTENSGLVILDFVCDEPPLI